MRQIYEINAHQVVISEAHPEGVYSTIAGFPVIVDSRSYPSIDENPNGNEEVALIVARAEFAKEVKELSIANTPSRVMWVVTLERADGRQIDRAKYGNFPDMTPIIEQNEEE